MFPLLLATRNAHKTREFAEILGLEFVVSDLSEAIGFTLVEETGATFAENAIIKAEAASRTVSDFVVADDSGLVVAALNGEPGVHSARYAGESASDRENVAKLLKELATSGSANQHAYFFCVLALARAGKTVTTFEGKVEGVITHSPSGENGFGYDPVFIPNGFDRTFAELGAESKNRISHRAMAIAQLRKYFAVSSRA